jgi:hypothetical protein
MKPGGKSNLEDAPHGTAVDPQHLVQCSVERSAVVAKLLPQLLLGLSLGKVGRRCAGTLPLLLWMRAGPPEAGRVARDEKASSPSAGHPGAAPPSSLTTSAPVGGSRAGAGRLTHWSQPGGGTSSSGISTTAA